MEIKGYWNEYAYMGYVNGNYIPFASEAEYIEYIKERRAYAATRII